MASYSETLVVAVSGGVDSVVLLHKLRATPARLVVAHFDHGIRPESGEDRRFVQGIASVYGLPMVYEEGRLGEDASEATARTARYAFLKRVREQHGAVAIVTAHHQDDLLETALINLLRGTGRRGLSSLRDTPELRRPLLHMNKQQIIEYAMREELEWCQDDTNLHESYLRNRVRKRMVPTLGVAGREKLLGLIETAAGLNDEIDHLLNEQIDAHAKDNLDRAWFKTLPEPVAIEIMAAWLRRNLLSAYDAPGLRRLTHDARTLVTGKQLEVYGGYRVAITRNTLNLVKPSLVKP